ncbi:MAG: response regulator transcription factor [Lachnospiraceae bacterium]|nr:response regulator transcription factor [Lachnospiraceae bacterium]
MYKIMIVEDDEIIARILSENLKQWGYETCVVTDFQAVTEAFVREQPHMVLLDITLPYYNGYYWCAEIRKVSKVPIIFISSNTSNMDIVMAINMGGDDFITKPFDLTVTLAKIQGMMRRAYSFTGQTNVIEHRGVVLNVGEASLLVRDKKVDLTKNEFQILQILMQNAGNVVSRDAIMKKLWDDEAFIDDNTLTVNVTRLRKKLEEAGETEYIKTKKGIGYYIEG